jgi:cutinase
MQLWLVHAREVPSLAHAPFTRRSIPVNSRVDAVVAVCQHCAVRARNIAVFVGAATVASWAPLSAPAPSASAQPCPDVEVVFARGTTEDPGVGPTGQAFVDSLRARVGTRSMGVYPVDYPATTDFPTALDGIRDASAHVRSTAANCPHTEMVLGGYSQGAAVMGFVTASVIPDGAPASGVPNPMPPDVADHVAAVALFGKPNDRFMRVINEPSVAVGPLYAAKTIEMCVPDDPICSSGTDFNAHMEYAETGMVDQAATFTASHLPATPAPATAPSPAPAAPAPSPAAPPQPPAPAAPPPAPAAPAPSPAAPPQPPAPASPPQPSAPAAPRPTVVQLPMGTLMSCQVGCHVNPPA